MSVFQTAFDLISGIQTELIVCCIAVCFHGLLFGKYKVGKKPTKSVGYSQKIAPSGGPTSGAFAGAVAAAAPSGSGQAALEAAILQHLPSVAAGTEVTVLEALVAGHCQLRGAGAELPRAVRSTLGSQGLKPTARLSELLLRAFLRSRAGADVRELFRGLVSPSAEALHAAAQFADKTGDADLAKDVLAKLPETPATEIAAPLLHCALAYDLGKTALGIYAEFFPRADLSGDPSLQQELATVALDAESPELLERLIAGSPSAAAAVIRGFASTPGGAGLARRVFEACPTKTTSLYNALICTATDCRDPNAAECVLKEAQAAGMADIVSYNTLIKAQLQAGSLVRGRAVLKDLRAAGLDPNCVTFNELIDASAKKSLRDMWELVNEMQDSGLKPNQVTCSIVLKSIQASSRPEDVERALAVVDHATEGMDEVLLSSLLEAAIRCNRPDLLARILRQQRSSKAIAVKGAYAFGSIIRAYGVLGDLNGVWDSWKELKSRRIRPSCITLGCMVEAVATNGNPDAAHNIIREALADPQTKPLVNAVMFCSVLKSYCHKRCFDKVWAIHEEMQELELQYSIVTYNALIDACARSSNMQRVHLLLENMSKDGIEPNVITYSTVLKGYCQDGRMDRAFTVLEDMKKSKCFAPDEVTFNTLLDGCARFGMYDRGLGVLADMEAFGVRPSNFTVSVLVKLANRSRRLDKAFELAEQVSRKYGFPLNMHVFNNLIQACTAAHQGARAMDVFEQMLGERVRPDSRTYKLLLRSAVQAGDTELVVGLLHAAVGKRTSCARLMRFAPAALQPKDGLASDAVTDALDGLVDRCRDEGRALELFRELRSVPGLSVNPKLPLRWASGGLRGTSQKDA